MGAGRVEYAVSTHKKVQESRIEVAYSQNWVEGSRKVDEVGVSSVAGSECLPRLVER